MLHNKISKTLKVSTLAALVSSSAFALPIDWHGAFGVDTTMINTYTRIKSTSPSATVDPGSQEVDFANGSNKASFQSYVFRLNPHLIVNDSASFKAEFTSGYGRGGFMGDSQAHEGNSQNGFGNALYVQNKSDGTNSLVINKAYMELYSDTATYQIGRHSSEWGLGALVNAGNDTWDRHTFTRDGITAKIKVGSFNLEPYWAKIDTGDTFSKQTKVTELGVGLVYDNIDRDIAFGILYTMKKGRSQNTSTTTDTIGTGTYALGETDVKITDIYFRKTLGDFSFEAEVPIISGDLGKVYDAQSVKTNSKSFLFETAYKLSDSWTLAFDFGSVAGHDGSDTSYNAMYLNPNYQIANLLFRYNLNAIADNNNNHLYDSYISNATYLKFAGEYKSDKWSWIVAAIWAKANETAKSGSSAYNHSTNKKFAAVDTQADDLGVEIDLNFDYHWNNAVTIGGSLGYLFTGEYYAFTNDPTNKNEADNTFAAQLRTSIEF